MRTHKALIVKVKVNEFDQEIELKSRKWPLKYNTFKCVESELRFSQLLNLIEHEEDTIILPHFSF